MPPRLPFRFKRFEVAQEGAAHPVGTDGVVLGTWADIHGARRILDVGTGTGLVALLLAQRTEHQEGMDIVGVDVHGPSVALAAANFAASPWAECLSVWHGKIQEYALASAPASFDLIVSNPPFFPEATASPDALRQLGRHAAHLPLTDLLSVVQHLLRPDGKFCVILPPRPAQHLCEQAVIQGLYWNNIALLRACTDKPVERWLMEFSRHPHQFKREEWILQANFPAYQKVMGVYSL